MYLIRVENMFAIQLRQICKLPLSIRILPSSSVHPITAQQLLSCMHPIHPDDLEKQSENRTINNQYLTYKPLSMSTPNNPLFACLFTDQG